MREATDRMADAVAQFRQLLVGINTGHVRPELLETIRVDAYGELVPLSHIATVCGGARARMLRVSPFDSSLVGAVVKAIQRANLGLNPQASGNVVDVAVPMPDLEQREKLVARVRSLAEQQRIAVRNIRKDARNRAKRLDYGRGVENRIEEQSQLALAAIDELAGEKIHSLQH